MPVLPGGGNDFYVALGNAGAHVIADVAGYYAAPIATPLDCTEVDVVEAVPAGSQAYVNAMCPAGRTATGGGGTVTGYPAPGRVPSRVDALFKRVDVVGLQPVGQPGQHQLPRSAVAESRDASRHPSLPLRLSSCPGRAAFVRRASRISLRLTRVPNFRGVPSILDDMVPGAGIEPARALRRSGF